MWKEKLGLSAGGPMKVRILSLNVRGVNSKEKWIVIKSLIRTQKVDLVCLHETKVNRMSILVRSLGGERCPVFWDNRVLELVEMEVGVFSIYC